MLLMIFSLKVQAQLTNGNFTDEVDYRLQNINKTSITSNILIDRVVPVAGIQVFNQGSRIDTSSYAHFKQAYSELYRASYSKNFVTLQQLKIQIHNKNYSDNVVPIGIINTEFHQGNYGTTAQNANVDFNPTTGLFANKANRNPFIKKQTTIIAPLISKVTGNSIQFKTDDNLTHISPLFYPNPVVGAVHTLATNIFFDKLVADFYHSSNKKYGNEEHFTFDGGIKGKFLWWSWYTTRTSFRSIANNKGSYDIAPGGYFNAQSLLANESEEPDDGIELLPFTLILHNLNTNVIDPTHSFIPIKSALAYTGTNVLDEVIGSKDRVCTEETPFDSYFAPEENENHIFLTPKNVA